MIRFICECGKQLQAHDDNAGKLVACPACQRQMTVPPASPPSESVQPERPLVRAEPELEEGQQITERPRPRQQPAGNSGKAVVSLILGILALFCNVLAGLPALIFGILALGDIGRSRGRLSGQGLAIAGIVTGCVCTLLNCVLFPFVLLPALLLPAVQKVREAADQVQSASNLHYLGVALSMYNDVNDTLPPAGFGDPDKPPKERRVLLSWRVAILPYLDQQALYNRFKLDEPWDSPNNIKLLEQMPAFYKLSGNDKTPPGHTHYQVFVGKGAAFEMTKGYNISQDFPDGPTKTILIVEAEKAVPWTKPEDIDFDPNKPLVALLRRYSRRGFQVLMADGHIHDLDPQVSENTFKAAITRNGGDMLGPDWSDR